MYCACFLCVFLNTQKKCLVSNKRLLLEGGWGRVGVGTGMETDNVEATRGDVPSPLRQRRSEAGKRHFTAGGAERMCEHVGPVNRQGSRRGPAELVGRAGRCPPRPDGSLDGGEWPDQPPSLARSRQSGPTTLWSCELNRDPAPSWRLPCAADVLPVGVSRLVCECASLSNNATLRGGGGVGAGWGVGRGRGDARKAS